MAPIIIMGSEKSIDSLGISWKKNNDSRAPANGAVPKRALVLAAPRARIASMNKAMLAP
jgi:hypothetical protein